MRRRKALKLARERPDGAALDEAAGYIGTAGPRYRACGGFRRSESGFRYGRSQEEWYRDRTESLSSLPIGEEAAGCLYFWTHSK